MSGLLSYSGLTTKIRAMQSHLLNDQNFREIVELESVAVFSSEGPQTVKRCH